MGILCKFLKQVGPNKQVVCRMKKKGVNLYRVSRLEKGGKGGKIASRVGKNLKMLIEVTRLFGIQE